MVSIRILFVCGIACLAGLSAAKAETAKEKAPTAADVESICPNMEKFVQTLLSNNMLAPPQRAGSHAYYISEVAWRQLTVKLKEKTAYYIWGYHVCSYINGEGMDWDKDFWVEIHGLYSGDKLAKYSGVMGFKEHK